jgi:ribosome-associated heat shock protein Hsp15
MSGEDKDWQRLDKWLWCARFLKTRSDCARLVAEGSIRINRQATDKAHARLRVGDVLTLPLVTQVRVVQVLSLAGRRGPAAEARSLYRNMIEPVVSGQGCQPGQSASYAAAEEA